MDAEYLIKQSIEKHGDQIGIACSFGKDSMIPVFMALKYKSDIKIIFENTGVEFPETIKFKERMRVEWNLNLFETKPIKNFWQCVDEYGLPEPRKRGGEGSNAPECCQYLKEKPGLMLQRELGIVAVITGMQACENNNRALLAMRYDNKKAPYMEKDSIEFCSQRWYTRSTNTWMIHPIMLWSVDDVWNYTFENDIPVNEVYTKWDKDGRTDTEVKPGEGLYPRCGCLPCTAYNSWMDRLPLSHPKLYEMLIKIKGRGQLILK